MKTLPELQNDLKRAFLQRQTVLTDVTEGGVIHGFFGAVSNELENVYQDLDRFFTDYYIDRASGAELDKLINGNFRLTRTGGAPAYGYLVFQALSPLSPGDISGLFGTLPLAMYDLASGTAILNPDAATVDIVSPLTGESLSYQLCLPLLLSQSARTQQLASGTDLGDLFLSDLLAAMQSGKKFSHLVLPVVCTLTGEDGNLAGGALRSTGGNLPRFLAGAVNFPTLYMVDSLGRPQYAYDPDGVAYAASNIELRLSTGGNLSGGTSQESDAAYRSRFYAWLNSRPSGTLDALLDQARNTPGVADVKIREQQSSVELRILPTAEASGDVASLALRVRQNLESVRSAGTRLNVAYAQPTTYHAVVHVRAGTNPAGDTLKSIKSAVVDRFTTLPFGETLTSFRLGREGLVGMSGVSNVERIDLYYALDDLLFASLSAYYLEWASSASLNWAGLNRDYQAATGQPWFDFAVWRYLVTLGTTGMNLTELVFLGQQIGRPLDVIDVHTYFPGEALLYLEPFTGLQSDPSLSCVKDPALRSYKEEALKITLLGVPAVMYKRVTGLPIDQRRSQSIHPDLNVVDIVCMRPDAHPGARDPYLDRMGAQMLVNNFEEPLAPAPLSHLKLAQNPLVAGLVTGMSSMVGVNIFEDNA